MQPEDVKINVDNIPKLKWACRRGMLELDVLLGNFLKEGYLQLSLEEKKLFIELLTCADPVLFTWLMGHETPVDEGLARITEMIRKHARSRI
jgi:antitoxin CptB